MARETSGIRSDVSLASNSLVNMKGKDTMTTKALITLDPAGSHFVTLDKARDPKPISDTTSTTYSWHITKEELYPTFRTEWRGAPVMLQMRADRYEHSSGLSDWRIVASTAYEMADPENPENQYARGAAVSDIARKRLADDHRQSVVDWLKSVDYVISRRAAVQRALARVADDLRGYSTPASRELRDASDAMYAASEIAHLQHRQWGVAANAFDRFTTAVAKAAM